MLGSPAVPPTSLAATNGARVQLLDNSTHDPSVHCACVRVISGRLQAPGEGRGPRTQENKPLPARRGSPS